MNASNFVAAIAALAAIMSAVLSFRSATHANNVSARKVDLEEYRDQAARYKSIIDEQDRQNDRLRSRVDQLNAQIDSVQAQTMREHDVSNGLREQIRALQSQIRSLEALINLQTEKGRHGDTE